MKARLTRFLDKQLWWNKTLFEQQPSKVIKLCKIVAHPLSLALMHMLIGRKKSGIFWSWRLGTEKGGKKLRLRQLLFYCWIYWIRQTKEMLKNLCILELLDVIHELLSCISAATVHHETHSLWHFFYLANIDIVTGLSFASITLACTYVLLYFLCQLWKLLDSWAHGLPCKVL